tara:strand:+ start:218 stop:625 length:408 start_codon:yes stop_codon:yes gene_type:complete
MAGLSVIVQLTKGMRLMKNLETKNTITKPLEDGIRSMAIRLEAEAKKATVVDTGRLRSSITHRTMGLGAEVGTNVKYAEFVEFGTQKMEARHMVGGRKVLGLGMLGYAISTVRRWAAKEGGDIAKNIARKITYGN